VSDEHRRQASAAGGEARGSRLGLAVTGRLTMLVASMRAGGARLGLSELLAAHRALAAVDPSSRRESRLALRPVLCSRRDDFEVFEAAFEACFGREELPEPPEELQDAGRLVLPRTPAPPAGAEATGEVELDEEVVPAAWSDVELLRETDFADYTDAERARARAIIARLGMRGPLRRSRRTRPVRRRRGDHPDLRGTLRASLHHFGEPIDRRWRASTLRARPLVLILDVSGSMEPYARALMQYAHACVAARRRVEVFAFGTRLTRITRELSRRDPDAALERAAHAVEDWHGGTRIGESLAALNREHGRRVSRGAVAVVLSDGWDRGDPDELAAEIARLHRCVHKLVWLNPLKAHTGYEPLTRGMVAAMPHLDLFLAGNSIAALEELARILEAV
jgi:uncharacterized protein